MASKEQLADASQRLYQHILKTHWNGGAVFGPDPGIRFNARIGRFIKGYLSFIPWSDTLIYAQAQKYWIASNWLMHELNFKDKESYSTIAIAGSDYLADVQRPEGYWEYPNPEWRGRIATVEGNYATIGMLESYLQTQKPQLLEGAKKWYEYAVKHIGFQRDGNFLAINYFGNHGTAMVPNNSASIVRVFAMLSHAANDKSYLEICVPMVNWLNHVQLETGELPYAVRAPEDTSNADRIHFLCHQYNAFEFLNLADYYDLTNDQNIFPVLKNLANYLATGITETGACRYTCHREFPEVAYYTTALAASLRRASQMGFGDFNVLADQGYARLLSQQKKDGNMQFYSRKNYGILSDKRSYPRYLSMILYHLLVEFKHQRKHSSEEKRG
ncbi:MAG: hypothetical protein H6696_20235 [Deferribacteres bacterium]|nr:hypothetical protein [candidate division KSB1 bacterium]MCB9504260.1 hypothetical protein [Deferribacteres bacterium]